MNSREDTNSSEAEAGDDADLALLARIANGDRSAFEVLYASYYHPLLRFIYRLTGDLDGAQEGINDTLLVVWQKAATFGNRSRVSTWIFGIAYRKALKHLQKSRRWWSRFKSAEWSEMIEPGDTAPGHTEVTETQDLLDRALRVLPPRQRAVVELTYYYGYSYEEIATIVECPVNTVKTRMFHARARLRDVLPPIEKDGRES